MSQIAAESQRKPLRQSASKASRAWAEGAGPKRRTKGGALSVADDDNDDQASVQSNTRYNTKRAKTGPAVSAVSSRQSGAGAAASAQKIKSKAVPKKRKLKHAAGALSSADSDREGAAALAEFAAIALASAHANHSDPVKDVLPGYTDEEDAQWSDSSDEDDDLLPSSSPAVVNRSGPGAAPSIIGALATKEAKPRKDLASPIKQTKATGSASSTAAVGRQRKRPLADAAAGAKPVRKRAKGAGQVAQSSASAKRLPISEAGQVMMYDVTGSPARKPRPASSSSAAAAAASTAANGLQLFPLPLPVSRAEALKLSSDAKQASAGAGAGDPSSAASGHHPRRVPVASQGRPAVGKTIAHIAAIAEIASVAAAAAQGAAASSGSADPSADSDDATTKRVAAALSKQGVTVPLTAKQIKAKDREMKLGEGYSRKDKSLALLCERFLTLYNSSAPRVLSLEAVSAALGVERRRIYDIVNVLESLRMLEREAKNEYRWHGLDRLTDTLTLIRREILVKRYHVIEICSKQAEAVKVEGSSSTLASAARSSNPMLPSDDAGPVLASPTTSDVTAAGATGGRRLSPGSPTLSGLKSMTSSILAAAAPAPAPQVPASNSNAAVPSPFDSPRTDKSAFLVSMPANQRELMIQLLGLPCAKRYRRSGPLPTSIKADCVESQDVKSLGALSFQFVQLFLLSETGVISLSEAAQLLLGEDLDVTMKSKVRRLYDIANVLTSLGLIKKIFNMRDRKPAFQWLHKVQPPFLGGVLPPRPVSPLPQDVQASLAASASGTAGASSTGASTGSDGSKLLTIGRYGKLDRKAVRRKPVPRGVRAAATAAAAAANAMGAVVAVLTPSQGKASSATDYILYQNAVEAQRKQHLLLKEANAQLIAAQSGAVLKQNSDGDTAYGFETIRTSGFPGTSSLIVVGPAASGLAPSASSGSLPRSGSLSFAFNGQNSSENGSSSNIARAGRGRKRSRTVAVVAVAGNRGQVDHPAEPTAELVGVGTVDPFSVASTNMATSPSKPSAAPPQPLVGMVLHRNGDCDCVGVCGLPLDQHGVNAPPQMVMIPSAGVTAAVAQVSSMPASEASLLAPAASVSAIASSSAPAVQIPASRSSKGAFVPVGRGSAFNAVLPVGSLAMSAVGSQPASAATPSPVLARSFDALPVPARVIAGRPLQQFFSSYQMALTEWQRQAEMAQSIKREQIVAQMFNDTDSAMAAGAMTISTPAGDDVAARAQAGLGTAQADATIA